MFSISLQHAHSAQMLCYYELWTYQSGKIFAFRMEEDSEESSTRKGKMGKTESAFKRFLNMKLQHK